MPIMKDGFKTLIEFTNLPNTQYREVTIKPPGWDGRGGIDITSMRNTFLTTSWPKQLVTATDITGTMQWDPLFWANAFVNLLAVNQLIRLQLPTLQMINFWGWLDRLEPTGEHKEGEQPLLAFTVKPSNLDNNDNEVTPFLT